VFLRDLTPADAPAFEQFDCRVYRQPWTDIVQAAIREGLAETLKRGRAKGVGLWEGEQLKGLVAWAEASPELWTSHLLAVAAGGQRRGSGTLLKRTLLERAWSTGCIVVVSIIHRDNEGMYRINRTLGARIELDPDDPLRNTLLCRFIRLPGAQES
jgi:GNAT superfamily N-acetyltransferase